MDNLEKCQSSLNKMMEYSFDLESQLIMKDEEMLQKQRFDRVIRLESLLLKMR